MAESDGNIPSHRFSLPLAPFASGPGARMEGGRTIDSSSSSGGTIVLLL
jgi:hypothetical protein